MPIYEAGMTGTEFLAALNKRKVFNVLEYGAVGNGIANETAVLQAVIELSHVNGGVVYIPSGSYLTNKLTTYLNVRIVGDGGASILLSAAAEPLVECLHPNWVGVTHGDYGLNHIFLKGNSLGTIGWNTQIAQNFYINGLMVHGFSDKGIYLHGSLVGSFENCNIQLNNYGVYADAGLGIAPNLVTFKKGQINHNTKYGFSWNNGLMLKCENVDFEDNGISGVADSGAIEYNLGAMNSGDQNLGLMLNGCWFESNLGTVVNIKDSVLTKQIHIISDCMFIVNPDSEVDIKIDGTLQSNRLILRNTVIKDSDNIIVYGANAVVVNDNSFVKGFNLDLPYGYGDVTLTNGGKYFFQRTWEGYLTVPQITAALTDDTPTDAEIDAATGLTPAEAKAGYQCTIVDSTGSGLSYKVESDGTYWSFVKMTRAT